MKSFTINRSSWHRGDGATSRLLLRQDNKRDIAGFICKQHGISDEALAGKSQISDLPQGEQAKLNEFGAMAHLTCTLNDRPGLADVERERILNELAFRFGCEFVFTE